MAFVIFAVQALLAAHWDANGVFDQFNVIFDTDPNQIKGQFSHGWTTGEFNHPLLSYYFSTPIRTVVAALSRLGLINDQIMTRETIALYIPPVLSGIKGASIFFSFRFLGLSSVEAALTSLVAALSFSSLIFGSTPSSYVVSGTGLSLVTLFSLMIFHKPSNINKNGLLIVGLFSIGTTASNIIHYGWMNWMSRMNGGKNPMSELAGSIVSSTILIFFTLALSFIIGLIVHGSTDPSKSIPSKKFIENYKSSGSDHLSNIVRFPEILARSFIPSTPQKIDNILAIKNGNPIKFELTYNGAKFGHVSSILWLTGLIILGGAIVSYHLGGIWFWAGSASAASILTTGVVFTWFGTNTFLFSQYWQVPGVILIGAWIHLATIKLKLGRILATALIFLFLIGDIHIIHKINSDIVKHTYLPINPRY